MSEYDNWKTKGLFYTCVCGVKWSESDGFPCHYICKFGKMHEHWETCECFKEIKEYNEEKL